MSKIVSICYMSGGVFKEIEYNNFDELYNKLKLIIIDYDEDISISLLINDVIINDFNILDINIINVIDKMIFVLHANWLLIINYFIICQKI